MSHAAELAGLAVAVAIVVLLIRALARYSLAWIAETAAHLPQLASSRAWARAQPIQAWLRTKHPRVHTILRARFAPGSFTGLPLTLLVLAALYVAALLGGLTEEVIEAGAVLRFDQAINAAFGPWRQGPLLGVFLWITVLGTGSALTAVAATASGFLWADRRPGFIAPLWIAFLGAQATTWAGKFAIARHRPDFIAAVSAASPSFPSGHATGSMALYGFVAYALVRDLPGQREQFEVAFWVGVLIAVIGFSRIFLSVHYTTDVLAGFLVGGFWLLVGFTLAEWTRGARNRA